MLTGNLTGHDEKERTMTLEKKKQTKLNEFL
jgi:hypothetical protein